MKPSFLTLNEVKFFKIKIDTDNSIQTKASEYDFENALLGCDTNFIRNEKDSNNFIIYFSFANSNDGEDISKCPYLFEFQAVASISIDDAIEEEQKEKLVFESGSAMIYSSIREMVINLTSRGVSGQLTLPTPSFKNSYEEYTSKQNTNKKSKKVKKK